jgi:hypothetical protein
MPRAIPGAFILELLRRRFPVRLYKSVQNVDRRAAKCLTRGLMAECLPSIARTLLLRNTFTLPFSGFGVARGRLGEVERLVGDCRPPPPGNPRRPATIWILKHQGDEWRANPTINRPVFSHQYQQNGGFFMQLWKGCSFNIKEMNTHLKKLKNIQYFKNIHSSFYCTLIMPVLESSIFHSHLCGVRVVEPPSIAMTNVLDSMGNNSLPHAVPLSDNGEWANNETFSLLCQGRGGG